MADLDLIKEEISIALGEADIPSPSSTFVIDPLDNYKSSPKACDDEDDNYPYDFCSYTPSKVKVEVNPDSFTEPETNRDYADVPNRPVTRSSSAKVKSSLPIDQSSSDRKARLRRNAELERARRNSMKEVTEKANPKLLEARRLKKNERERQRWLRKKEEKAMKTSEEQEIVKKRKPRPSNLTDEEKRERKREYKTQENLRRKERLSQMTEEEIAKYKIKQEEAKQKKKLLELEKLASMTEEEIAEYKKKLREKRFFQRAAWSPEKAERIRQQKSKYRRIQMSDPEKRKKRSAQINEYQKRNRSIFKYRRRLREENPEKYQQMLDKRSQARRTRARLATLKKKSLEECTEAEKAWVLRPAEPRGPTKFLQRAKSERVEEKIVKFEDKAQKRKEHSLVGFKRRQIRKKLLAHEMREKGCSIEEIADAVITQAEWEKDQLYRAKSALKLKLKKAGVPPEEIQMKLGELATSFHANTDAKARKDISKYFLPLTDEELQILSCSGVPFEKMAALAALALPTTTSIKEKGEMYFKMAKLYKTEPNKQSFIISSNKVGAITIQKQKPSAEAQFCSGASSPTSYIASEEIQGMPEDKQPSIPEADCNSHDNYFEEKDSFSSPPSDDKDYCQGQDPIATASHSMSSPYQQHLPQTSNSLPTDLAHPPDRFYIYNNEVKQLPAPVPSLPHQQHQAQESFSVSSVASSTSFVWKKQRKPNKANNQCKKNRKPGRPSGSKSEERMSQAVICDECGNPYHRDYIECHKLTIHNPNYSEGRCLLCDIFFERRHDFKLHHKQFHRTEEEKKADLILSRPRRTKNKDSPFVCASCGGAYASLRILQNHEHLVHGEGSKPENCIMCHLCPNRRFKTKATFNDHMRRVHPEEETAPAPDICPFCLENVTTKKLPYHVQENHPESYFPCQFCKYLKFSRLGQVHHQLKCNKATKEQVEGFKNELKEKGECGMEEDLKLTCEFCHVKVIARNLRNHYQDVHRLKETGILKCEICCARGGGGKGKEFTPKSRYPYIVHMESVHKWTVEKAAESCTKAIILGRMEEGTELQVFNREGKKTRRGRQKSQPEFEEELEKGVADAVMNGMSKSKFIETRKLYCEICSYQVNLKNLKVHLWNAHKLKEDKPFVCLICDDKGKQWNSRPYFVLHLLEKHKMNLKDSIETCKAVSMEDRSKVEELIKNEVDNPKKKKSKSKTGVGCGKRGRKKVEDSNEEEEDTSESEDDEPKRKRKLRNLSPKKTGDLVIKNEMEDSDLSNLDGESDSLWPYDLEEQETFKRGTPKKVKSNTIAEEKCSIDDALINLHNIKPCSVSL